MSLDSLMVTDGVLIKPALTTDRNRNQVTDWANATRTRVRGWLAQMTAVELIEAGRDAGVSTWAYWLPAGTAIDSSYRVQIGTDVFFVDGPVNRANTPRGEHHVEVRLSLVTA